MKAVLVVVSAVLIVLSTSFGADRPGGKQGKRIDQIEKDFDVHFVQTIQVRHDEKYFDYWSFVKRDDHYSIKIVIFATPVNSTDKQVTDSMVSAMSNASFWDMVFKAASKAKQDNNPIFYQGFVGSLDP